MDLFSLLVGFCLILISIGVFIQQIKHRSYANDKITIGKVNRYFAGLVSFLAGLYFLINTI